VALAHVKQQQRVDRVRHVASGVKTERSLNPLERKAGDVFIRFSQAIEIIGETLAGGRHGQSHETLRVQFEGLLRDFPTLVPARPGRNEKAGTGVREQFFERKLVGRPVRKAGRIVRCDMPPYARSYPRRAAVDDFKRIIGVLVIALGPDLSVCLEGGKACNDARSIGRQS
jgi:hypothetical protein